MAGRRLLRFFYFSGFLLGLATATSAWGTASRPDIVWASAQLDQRTPTAKTTSGRQVELGTDPALQAELSRLLSRAKPIAGAAAMVDARSGQVLAADEVGKSAGGSLLFDAIAPAASVFKIVTTAALYEHTSVTPLTKVCTHGGQRDILREHLSAARGPEAICSKFAYALGVSRNAAYAQLATQKLLRADLVSTAKSLGFGQTLSLDASGKVGNVDVPYNDLAFARTATGFENSKLSVFGGAQLALVVASGGMLRPMHFQKVTKGATPKRILSPRTARRLRNAMEVTIHSGTARDSFIDEHGRSTVGPVQVAGKTGTLKPSSRSPTSSWFIGFAPSENPRVVVSVVLQNPDKWVRKGHQVGRDLLSVYLESIGVRGIRPI